MLEGGLLRSASEAKEGRPNQIRRFEVSDLWHLLIDFIDPRVCTPEDKTDHQQQQDEKEDESA
jgi:hypothetical protein